MFNVNDLNSELSLLKFPPLETSLSSVSNLMFPTEIL